MSDRRAERRCHLPTDGEQCHEEGGRETRDVIELDAVGG